MTTEPGCPFCELLAPTREPIVVIAPLRPVVPGHVLVIPKRHVRDATEDPDVTADVMRVAAWVADGAKPCNIITSVGAATQTVFHLHVHVVPRRPGDGLKLPWTEQSGQ